jgi:hypothetical protein
MSVNLQKALAQYIALQRLGRTDMTNWRKVKDAAKNKGFTQLSTNSIAQLIIENYDELIQRYPRAKGDAIVLELGYD